ncbi:MAG: GNAT family N-acetyltransferase [Gammaproteobacteria bacterium]|nr:GNAT family N-acetyltransferase [Gammaproteobacteria bacterium]
MTKIIEIDTKRLKLRQWRKDDLPIFAKLNADPVVMKYYPDVLSEKQSNEMAEKIESSIAQRGWGFWAVEKTDNKNFIGFVGLNEPTYDLPVTPCVEIGWRLAKKYWGNGYATEAAKAAMVVAFDKLNFSEIVSFTSVSNKQSRAVMERLGMINMQENFEHPLIPENSPLREHVLYKIEKQHWKAN